MSIRTDVVSFRVVPDPCEWWPDKQANRSRWKKIAKAYDIEIEKWYHSEIGDAMAQQREWPRLLHGGRCKTLCQDV